MSESEKELRAIAYNILEAAKVNLKRDGYLQPVGLLVTDKALEIVALNFVDHESKVRAIDALKSLAVEHKASAVITVTEAWIARAYSEKDIEMYFEVGAKEMPNRKETIQVTVASPFLRLSLSQQTDTSNGSDIKIIGDPEELEGGDLKGNLFEGLWDDEFEALQSLKDKEVN